jgi:hypothetical protein
MMDSHAGSMPSDMRAFARLVGEGGAETRPSAWAWSSENEGHHRSVRLSFPAAGLEAGGVCTLVLGSDDVRNGRRFEWTLPSKAANRLTGGA